MPLVRTTLKLQCDRGYNSTDNKLVDSSSPYNKNPARDRQIHGPKTVNSPEYNKNLSKFTENVQHWKHPTGHYGEVKHSTLHLVREANPADKNWFAM